MGVWEIYQINLNKLICNIKKHLYWSKESLWKSLTFRSNTWFSVDTKTNIAAGGIEYACMQCILQILQYRWKITGYSVFFFYQIDELRNFYGSRIRIWGEIYVTEEHAFISREYLHAANACKFRVHFPWVPSHIASVHRILQVLPPTWIISIDCINYFFHREINIKKRSAHFLLWKPSSFIKCSIRFFLDSLLS